MKTTNVNLGDTVYITSIGSIKKCTVDAVYENALSCKDEDGHLTVVYGWYITLDDALQSFLNRINAHFETSYKLEKDER